MDIALALTLALATAGAAAVLVGATRHRPATGVVDYLRDLDGGDRPADEFEATLAEPFVARVLRPLASSFGSITRFTPANHIERVRHRLLTAGLANQVRAEEFVVAQVASVLVFTVGALAWVALASPSPRMALLAVVLLPAVGVLLPTAWLTRKVEARKAALRKDLPDTLDLLAISVEAGMGFEGAVAIVCQHFRSPLADELHRALREMELGLPRREAFQNLKRRTDVPELSNFVLALLQADALGIPIGRVLRTQAAEMRARRRQWARERAAKLPVKMLVPLVLFIFPSILIVILGPAVPGLTSILG